MMRRAIAATCVCLASLFTGLSLGFFLLAAVIRRSRRDMVQSSDTPGPGEHEGTGMSTTPAAPADDDIAQTRAAIAQSYATRPTPSWISIAAARVLAAERHADRPPLPHGLDDFDRALADVLARDYADRTIFRVSAPGEVRSAVVLNRDGARA